MDFFLHCSPAFNHSRLQGLWDQVGEATRNLKAAIEQLREMGSAVDLPTGYDFENDEVLFTLNGRDLTDIIADGEVIATVALTSGGGQILTDVEMVRPPVRPWEDETFDWEDVPVDFDDHCNDDYDNNDDKRTTVAAAARTTH